VATTLLPIAAAGGNSLPPAPDDPALARKFLPVPSDTSATRSAQSSRSLVVLHATNPEDAVFVDQIGQGFLRQMIQSAHVATDAEECYRHCHAECIWRREC
jgi:hypothetical protein